MSSKVFSSWDELNKSIVLVDSEETCRKLLEAELDLVKPRGMFVLRIHSRLNRLRAARERIELMAKLDHPPAIRDFRKQRKASTTRRAALSKALSESDI